MELLTCGVSKRDNILQFSSEIQGCYYNIMHVRDFVFENNIYVKYITLINYRIWLINENSDRHELI